MRVTAFGCVFVASLVAACGGSTAESGSAPAPPPQVQIGAENVVTVERGEIMVGPMISGELRAAREATVRAELGGSMTQVTVDEGQTVRKGALLGRIDARTLEEARQSAASAVRSAENQLALARREAERTEQLVSAGAVAARELDVARSSVSAAEAQLADARARLANAHSNLGDAVISAPIAGVVSDRAVGVGDVVSPGTALFTVIDPSSMRLEASVPSDDLQALRVGASVRFDVRGYEQPFEGRIERIAPQADPTTRQIPIYVAIPNTGGRLVAGLFAEGRVVTDAAHGLIVPINAVNLSESTPWVLRVASGKTEKVQVTVGLRDRRTERVQIASGVNDKDVLLRGTAQGITPGTSVAVGAPR
jgi:RND family efflux transporter MFP subunit